MTSIYFPARTNVHYWDLEPLELDLDSRLKLSAILYDELIFDDGVYMALIGPKLSMDLRIPMKQIPDGYFDRQLPREGGEFAVGVAGEMMESPAQRRYQLCFRKLLEEAGLEELPWVSFNDQEFDDKGKKAIKQLAERDMKVFHNGDRETYLLHSQILQSLNHDWVMGSLKGWDLNLGEC